MKSPILLSVIFFAFSFSTVRSQSPGGVSPNLTLWLKANTTQPANIVYNASNQVSEWRSETGTYNVTQANVARQPLFGSVTSNNADFNFNPFIQFNSSNSTSLTNPSTTPNLMGTNGTVIIVTNKYIGAGQGSVLTYMSNFNYRFQIKPTFRAQNGANSIGYKFELVVASNPSLAGTVINYTETDAFLLAMVGAGPNSRVRRNATDCGPSTGNVGTYFPSVSVGLSLGANGGASEFTNHALGEVIMYDRALSAPEINKVESYLALKYGVSLDEIPTSPVRSNYTTSGGTVIWDKTTNNGFNENITGIGRDDASALNQKQSHSVNFNSPLFIFNGSTAGNFPVMNDSNTTTFAADLSFLVAGENKLSSTLDQCTVNGHVSRMARTWKVQKTGSIDSVTIAFLKDSLPACTQSLIVSADPSFPASSTRTVRLTEGTKYKYATVFLNNAEYFSFGSDSIPVIKFDTVRVCPGNPVTFTVTNPLSCMSYAWYDAPAGGNQIGTGTGFTMSSLGSNDTTFYLETTGPANCIAAARSTATVVRKIVTTPVAEGDSLCAGQTATLSVTGPQPGFIYNWYDSPSGGTPLATGNSFTTPPVNNSTTYYLAADSLGCNSLFIPVTADLYNTETPSVISPVFTCPNTTASLSVSNPVSGSTYNWYNVATGGTALGSGVTFTTTAIAAASVYYVEAVNSNGCPGVRTAVNVDLYPAAAAPDVITPVVICANTTTQLQIQNPQAGFSYNWYSSASGGTTLGTGTTYTTGNISNSTVFYAEAVSTDGCISALRAPVNVNIDPAPAPPLTNAPVNVCETETATLTVTNPNPAFVYNWYDSPSSTTPVATGTSYTTPPIAGNTNFYVTATNATGCAGTPATASVQLWPLLPSPVVQVTDSSLNSLTFSWSPVPGASGYIVSTDGVNYTAPSSGATGTTHVVTGLSPDTYVTLQVIAQHPLDCRISLPGSATGHTWPEQTDVYVPAAFTPNGDGLNDELHVLGTNIRSVYFIVYNRWGQKVFESNDVRRGWNGEFNRKPQNAGSFVYYVKAIMLDGKTIIKKGSTILIRQ